MEQQLIYAICQEPSVLDHSKLYEFDVQQTFEVCAQELLEFFVPALRECLAPQNPTSQQTGGISAVLSTIFLHVFPMMNSVVALIGC